MISEGDQRILIVDDDPDSVILLKKHLSNAGYEVFTASDGHEALRVILSEGPLIIITDWMMPGMDGLELCRAIRNHEAIPFAFIIIVTAHQTMEDNIVEAFEAGADDYLTKPINPKELLARLRAARRIIELQQEVSKRTRQLHHHNAQMAITNVKLAESNEKLNRVAKTDSLTGLINRRAVLERLQEYWSRSNRNSSPMACIMMDLDRFKSCNDNYGHDIGDHILKLTADTLSLQIRKDEIVSRFGGEEFVILCPEATEQEATVCAQRMREAIEEMVLERRDLRLKVTASLGVAQRTSDMNSPEDLLRAADQAMYAAKGGGRNKVCVASELASDPDDDMTKTNQLDNMKSVLPLESQQDGGVVLVVDDDAAQRILCKKILGHAGYEVVEAVDGVEALSKIKAHPPDVILMDVIMPNMDGLECIREIKKNHDIRHIPIIIVSGRTDSSDIIAGLKAGASEYLIKPIKPNDLAFRISSMIRLNKEMADNIDRRGEQSRAQVLISDFAQDIATSTTVGDVIDRTIYAAAELTCCKNVCVWLPDEKKNGLTLTKSMRRSPERHTLIRLPMDKGLVSQVYRTCKAVVCDASQCSALHEKHENESELMSCPSISVPLCVHDQVVGVLCMSDRHASVSFDSLEMEYIQLICNIAASAIHERMTRQARDEARHSIVVALAQLAEHRDSDAGTHLYHVGRYCLLLAKQLQSIEKYQSLISDDYLENLLEAVPLHDIGKVAIPDRILLKRGSLTDEEFDAMKVHTVIGAKTLRSVIDRIPDVSYLNMAEEIALNHHEWYNGKGYPHGVKGEDIPLSARIVTVADVYDAITSKRIYKDAMPHADAVAIITNASGKQFDPDIVEAFIACEQQFKELANVLSVNPESENHKDDLSTQGVLPTISIS